MNLNARVLIDDFDLALKDDRQLITNMSSRLKKMVKRRSQNGVGSDGRIWASPKDAPAQAPLDRSGQLLASIDYKITRDKKNDTWKGSVQSKGGKRRDVDSKAVKRRAKASTEAARGAAAAAHAGSGALMRGAKITKTGKLSVRGVKRRGVVTNGNLAAILSTRPHDPAGIKGQRKTYRIYEARPDEVQALFGIAQTQIQPIAKKRRNTGR